MSTSPSEGLARPLQVAIALAVLVLAGPVLCVVALAIALTSPGPILFRHPRMGRDGRPFLLLKFRTMRVDQAGPDITATDDPRVTPLGKVLRRYKLDELPQLWNVVRDDMALVGPRPEAIRYVDLTSALWRDVLRVRPGITDPVTLRLRNEEELLAAVPLDREQFYRRFLLPYKLLGYRDYLAARTPRRDLAVLWLTVLVVMFPRRLPPPSLDEILGARAAADTAPPARAVMWPYPWRPTTHH